MPLRSIAYSVVVLLLALSARGNATPDEPQLLENVSYKVAPWEDVDMDVAPGDLFIWN